MADDRDGPGQSVRPKHLHTTPTAPLGPSQ